MLLIQSNSACSGRISDTWKFSGKESKGGEVFFDHVCYTIDAFKMSLKRSESKEYS